MFCSNIFSKEIEKLKAKPKLTKRNGIKENTIHVRASNTDLDILNQNAAAMKMPLSTYILWHSLKPLGRAIEEKKQQEANQLNYEVCLQIRRELNHQGINLNQIARSLASQIRSSSIDRILKDITEIEEINKSILEAITHTGKQ